MPLIRTKVNYSGEEFSHYEVAEKDPNKRKH